MKRHQKKNQNFACSEAPRKLRTRKGQGDKTHKIGTDFEVRVSNLVKIFTEAEKSVLG